MVSTKFLVTLDKSTLNESASEIQIPGHSGNQTFNLSLQRLSTRQGHLGEWRYHLLGWRILKEHKIGRGYIYYTHLFTDLYLSLVYKFLEYRIHIFFDFA